MKFFIHLTALIAAVSAPGAAALTADEARHLLHRTGYGVTVTEWQRIIALDYPAAVDLLVDEALLATPPAAPKWTADAPLWMIVQRGMSADERRELRKKKRALIYALSEWWLQQMLTTSTPLRERMTMFWSNHFTTEFGKIGAPMLQYRQHELLREHALGRYDALLHGIIKDAAMLLYLDNDKNRKDSINENLARELMELFTLGEGNYTERDVKEAARCLTGWGVERSSGEFRKQKRQHDNGVKTVLGRSGRFDADDLLDVLLDQPHTARHIVTKLWLEFISMQPDQAQIDLWARDYQASGYRTDSLLKTLFKSPQFRAPQNRGQLVKSPVELYAGLVRPALDGLTPEDKLERIRDSRAARRLPQLTRGAGQKLFDPPNVKGWPGGLKWIDSKTLLMREQAARNLVLGLSSDEKLGNPYARDLRAGPVDDKAPGNQMWMLAAIDPVTDIPLTYTDRRVLLEIVRDPVIHLK